MARGQERCRVERDGIWFGMTGEGEAWWEKGKGWMGRWGDFGSGIGLASCPV